LTVSTIGTLDGPSKKIFAGEVTQPRIASRDAINRQYFGWVDDNIVQ